MLSTVKRAALVTAAVLSFLFVTSNSALAQSTGFSNTDAKALARSLDLGVTTPAALAQAGAAPQVQVREADAGIGFGVFYGIVRPSFNDDNAEFTLSNKSGWKVGIFFGGNRDGRVGFWGKLAYKTKKAETASGVDLETKYLEIPAGFRINVGSSSRNSVVGFLDVGGIVDINIQKLDDANIPEDYLGTELGWYFGAGVEITRLIVELRWDRMVKSFYDPEAGFDPIHSNQFQVEFMFRIN
jgi:hypothetical protein